jgi:fructokinase
MNKYLYGRDDDGLIEPLFDRGVEIVLLTRGKLGAGIFTRTGLRLAPATRLASPIVDTMGAGDAKLACVIAFILVEGMPQDNEGWRACLTQAMNIAAATCRFAGAALARPLAAGT